MRSNHLSLFLALILALAGHIALLYPTPELIPIPLQEPAYSVEIQLTAQQANVNSREITEEADKDQIESQASKESKAEQAHMEESAPAKQQEQAGSEASVRQDKSSRAEVKIDAPTPASIKANPRSTHQFNTKNKQDNPVPAVEVAGKQDSEQETVEAPVIAKEDIKVADVVASKDKQASEQSKASNQKSVKSEEQVIQPELTAAERYEAQIYAWILNGPNAAIYSPTDGIKNPPTIEFTWWRNGTIIFAKVVKSSGDPATDSAAKRSVLSASPLPKIPDHIAGKEYTLNITFAQTEK